MSDRSYEIALLADDTHRVLSVLPGETEAAMNTIAAVVLHIASSLEVQEEGLAEIFVRALAAMLERGITSPVWPAIVEKERAAAREAGK